MSDLWISIHGFQGYRPAAHTWQQLLRVGHAWLYGSEGDEHFPALMIYEIPTSEIQANEPESQYPYFVFRTYRDAELRLLSEARCEFKISNFFRKII